MHARLLKPEKIYKVVFVRHGQSAWNSSNQFTGWADVPLTQKGIEQARAAGRRLKAQNWFFDIAYTSYLKRAVQTFNHVADELDCDWIPTHKHWRLNERHYGKLQGLNKKETALEYGEDQVLKWRRSYDNPPPLLDSNDERHPRNDPQYARIPPSVLPVGESLQMSINRVVPYWEDTIAPAVMDGQKAIVVGHENVLRGLVQIFSGMSNDEILAYNIPTATPFVYEFDSDLNPLRHYYILGEDLDEKKLRKMEMEVGLQSTSKHIDRPEIKCLDYEPISAEERDARNTASVDYKRI